MQDNFNIHGWRLKQSLQETEKIKGKDGKGCWKGYRYAGTENGKDKCVPVKENKGQCLDCGCEMEGKMCNECGYTMKEATFSGKYNDDPKLKGGQKDLPDEIQSKIVKSEGEDKRDFEVDDIVKVKATGKKGKVVDMSPSETFFIVNVGGKNSSFHESDIELIKRPSLNETEDHEVSMAQSSLKSIIGAASELMSKIGDEEFDIPGWIQDHITNSENYISQANKGYHKLDNKYED